MLFFVASNSAMISKILPGKNIKRAYSNPLKPKLQYKNDVMKLIPIDFIAVINGHNLPKILPPTIYIVIK